MFIVELGISLPPIGDRCLDPPATEIRHTHAYPGLVRHKGGWAEVLRGVELSHLMGLEMWLKWGTAPIKNGVLLPNE